MCKLCEKNPVYEFTNQRKLCARCFIKWFQKKFLYIIRKFGMIQSGDVIGFDKKSDVRSVVTEDLLWIFLERGIIEIVKFSNKNVTKMVSIATTSSDADFVVQTLIRGNAKDLNVVLPVRGKIIKPLYLFLDEEVEIYAKLRKLKFGNKVRAKKNSISEFVDGLEEKHPELKRAVIKSYLEIEKWKQ